MNELKSFTNDEHLALMLMTVWALSAGRVLPDRPPWLLTEEELIDFWAE
ncbi:hypothetical protein GCM10023191_030180 [Actinoallomurus oryzae]|jgi:hypothetical protein|uniref:Uncharacterized protein n=1 Tax=Actinoallomurus oryzae TaxID=502180 RepID=A0ABP8PVZ9_9ACTN